MASVLDKYGIKEVADVTFYELDTNGKPKNPVLYLDTLKVSTIEQTAEEAESRGGKGNPPLIIWDYGKEITVTLEDALFSAKSMAIMFGDGKTRTLATDATWKTNGALMFTEEFTASTNGSASSASAAAISAGWSTTKNVGGKIITKENPKFFDAAGSTVSSFSANEKYFCTYDVVTTDATVIEISANSFPGTYYVVGDTYARNEANGKDEFFQFIIPKAKVQSENTITLEAEGDPSVFNMNLRVLRPANGGAMMKLVKYDMGTATDGATAGAVSIIHNHELSTEA